MVEGPLLSLLLAMTGLAWALGLPAQLMNQPPLPMGLSSEQKQLVELLKRPDPGPDDFADTGRVLWERTAYEGVMFDDSWPHEVVNRSREARVVLIVDVPRPLPLVPRLVNHFVLWGLAAPSYAKKVVNLAERYSGDLL